MRISINFIRLPLLACAAAIALGPPAAVAGPEDNSLVFGQPLSTSDIGPAFNAFLQYPSGHGAAFETFNDQLRFNPQLAESWTVTEDQKSVAFQLWTHEPYAPLLNMLAHGSGAMFSPTAIMENGQESETQNPVGSGPYKVASFDSGLELVLEPRVGHWAGKPALDRTVFRYIPEASTRVSALQSGDVDVIDGVPTHLISQIEATDGLQILAAPSLWPMSIAMQRTIPPLDNVKVRRALDLAVLVDAIAEKLFLGQASASDLPLAIATVGFHGDDPFEFDPVILALGGSPLSHATGMVEDRAEFDIVLDYGLAAISVARMKYVVRNDDRRYAVYTRLEPDGIGSVVSDSSHETRVVGRIQDGKHVPDRYHTIENRSDGTSTTTVITYRNGVVDRVLRKESEDAQASVQSGGDAGGQDFLSIIQEFMLPMDESTLCQRTFNAFDGRKHNVIRLGQRVKQSGGNVMCAGTFQRLANLELNDAPEKPFTVYFQPVDGRPGLYELAELESDTNIGKLRVVRQ